MKQTEKFTITISRQLGSGGAYIGQELAKRLNIYYADREIINKVAKNLSVIEDDLESRDERILTFWQSFFQYNTFVGEMYSPPQLLVPSEKDLFQAEAEVIEHIAKERSAVIIGRCGSHILRDYPNHISLFFHSDMVSRIQRVHTLYKVTKHEAEKMTIQSDKERSLHCETFTDKDWSDGSNYNLCIDTGKIKLDKCVDLIMDYLNLIDMK